MALTASATPAVQKDIINNLAMKQGEGKLLFVKQGFNRPNLFYEVRYAGPPSSPARMADVHTFISSLHSRRGAPSAGIIYCLSRNTCDELSNYLRGKGLNARPYHKGLPYVKESPASIRVLMDYVERTL
jgi:bloom syndrome protein